MEISVSLCVWVSMHSVTPQEKPEVDGKKVTTTVLQYVFVPNRFLFLHCDVKTIVISC